MYIFIVITEEKMKILHNILNTPDPGTTTVDIYRDIHVAVKAAVSVTDSTNKELKFYYYDFSNSAVHKEKVFQYKYLGEDYDSFSYDLSKRLAEEFNQRLKPIDFINDITNYALATYRMKCKYDDKVLEFKENILLL